MRKKLLNLAGIFITLVSIVGFTPNMTVAAFSHQDGDILVTKDTSVKGLTGHTGIVVNGGENVVHIQDVNSNPERISISEWYSKYDSTKVVRPDSHAIGDDAAAYALNYFYWGSGKYKDYSITPNPKDMTYTYCSELVWTSYYEGAEFEYETLVTTPSRSYWDTPSIIYPYNYTNSYYQSHNGFDTVRSVNW